MGQEAKPPKSEPGQLASVLAILSNGFVLLLVGTAITSFLVPRYQQGVVARATQLKLMEEAHANFLQYTTSIWEEYYVIFPLLHESSIDKTTYNTYTKSITDIKLKRYQLFAKVRSLAVAFRSEGAQASAVEDAIYDYAVQVNGVSAMISGFVGGLYCGGAACARPQYSQAAQGDRIAGFDAISAAMQSSEQAAGQVASLMVEQIKER
jgi:hypothetical protein